MHITKQQIAKYEIENSSSIDIGAFATQLTKLQEEVEKYRMELIRFKKQKLEKDT